MKITKYDVHVHAVGNPHQEIVGKYFICPNDNSSTIKCAIVQSSDVAFQQYLNDKNYIIHIVSDQKLTKQEIAFFTYMIKRDRDPKNFFLSMNRVIL